MMGKDLKLLDDITGVLDKHRVQYWLMYGTLLGMVREKRIIPWDHDIDLGVWSSDYDRVKDLKDEFESLGYRVGFQRGSCSVITVYVVGFALDFVFWFRDCDKVVLNTHFNRNLLSKLIDGLCRLVDGDYYFRRKSVTPKSLQSMFANLHLVFLSRLLHRLHLRFCSLSVYDYSVVSSFVSLGAYSIPVGFESYLVRTYGKGWGIPDKGYTIDKWQENNSSVVRYCFQDKSVEDLWVGRWS